MKKTLSGIFTVSAILAGAATNVHAQQTGIAAQNFDRGKYEYETHCAECHGSNGEGNGPYASFLTKPVPNLTTLSKTNGGVFPFARVYEIVDGTQAVLAHGPRNMPIWGSRYNREAKEGPYDDFRSDAEAFVRARVLALTEYVYRLQAK